MHHGPRVSETEKQGCIFWTTNVKIGNLLRFFVFLASTPQPNFAFWGQALSRISTFLAFGVKPSAENRLVDF